MWMAGWPGWWREEEGGREGALSVCCDKTRWESDSKYCQKLLKPNSEYYHGILEFTDTAIYDFLMGMYVCVSIGWQPGVMCVCVCVGNADRHHYEVYSESRPHGKLMHIDNGKT